LSYAIVKHHSILYQTNFIAFQVPTQNKNLQAQNFTPVPKISVIKAPEACRKCLHNIPSHCLHK
jgi:hypothetical protein